MITYALFSQIRFLHEQGLSARQIARELKLGRLTVRRWLQRDQFQPRARSPRPSKLDPWRGELLRLLHLHPYSAQQLFQQLQARGYTGSYSILKRFVRQVRPKAQPAFLTLQFAPGECAQVDGGFAGLMPVGATRRRVSFFVMVQQLEARHLNARHHARHILALSELYGVEPVQRALDDAIHYQAFNAQYIANLLQQRQRQLPEPGALHLTRASDLLELDLPTPDLSVYEPKNGGAA